MTSNLEPARLAQPSPRLTAAEDEQAAALAEELTQRDRAQAGADEDQMVLPFRVSPAAAPLQREIDGADGFPARDSPPLLFDRLTGHLRGHAKDPPDKPPGIMWLLAWVPFDIASRIVTYPRRVRASGGEARMHARIRASILDLGWTLFTVLMIAGLLYWTARLMFDPTPIGEWFDTVVDRIRGLIGSAWEWIQGLDPTASSLIVAGALGSGWLVRLITQIRSHRRPHR